MEKGMGTLEWDEAGEGDKALGTGRGWRRGGIKAFLPRAQVRPGQFHRRLWRSTRRISQVSARETEYNPCEGRG